MAGASLGIAGCQGRSPSLLESVIPPDILVNPDYRSCCAQIPLLGCPVNPPIANR